jgi:hypothetical protein
MLCSSFSAMIEGDSGKAGGTEVGLEVLDWGGGDVGALDAMVVSGGGSLGGGEVRRAE